MNLKCSKEFPFSMETAWKALQKPGRLDVEPGTTMKEISDTEWETYNSETDARTTYTASFDEKSRKVIIEGAGNKKHDHDFIYFTLTEISGESVKLDLEIEINTGTHFIAKALGALISKPAGEIMSRHIFRNFEALCTGGETRTMTSEELRDAAKKVYEK